MEINIQAIHFTANTEQTDFITEKVKKLEHFFDRIEVADVILKIENSATGNKVCEIKLVIPGNDLFVKKHADTIEAAASACVLALQEQITKLKTKMGKH